MPYEKCTCHTWKCNRGNEVIYSMNKGKAGSIFKMVELGQGRWMIPRRSPLFYSRCLINQQYKKSKKPKDNNIRNKK